jgi:hypothetical protein
MPSHPRTAVNRTPLKLLQSTETLESSYPLTKSHISKEEELQYVRFALHVTVYSYLKMYNRKHDQQFTVVYYFVNFSR